MRLSSAISVSGSAAASVSSSKARAQLTSLSAIASFSRPWRTISATRISSALIRSRSISDCRSTSEIAWPFCGWGNCMLDSNSGCWSKKSG